MDMRKFFQKQEPHSVQRGREEKREREEKVQGQEEPGTEQAEKLPTTPRLIKTHLPVQFVPQSFWQQRCRIIYVARNAKDNVVSYFHFARMNSALPEPGDWSSYLQEFMEGKRAFGS
uniref:Sulfotransferase n=1 Tax=Oreochromis aureus TaxID=47969 RepID=A0A668RTE7_OREAU